MIRQGTWGWAVLVSNETHRKLGPESTWGKQWELAWRHRQVGKTHEAGRGTGLGA